MGQKTMKLTIMAAIHAPFPRWSSQDSACDGHVATELIYIS